MVAAPQSPALLERQEELLRPLREKVTERCWERHFADLMLVEDNGEAGLVFRAPTVETARYLRAFYLFGLEQSCGAKVEIRP